MPDPLSPFRHFRRSKRYDLPVMDGNGVHFVNRFLDHLRPSVSGNKGDCHGNVLILYYFSDRVEWNYSII